MTKKRKTMTDFEKETNYLDRENDKNNYCAGWSV